MRVLQLAASALLLSGGTIHMVAGQSQCPEGSIKSSDVCCVEECGRCGGEGCSGRTAGGADDCCLGRIRNNDQSCLLTNSPPCVLVDTDSPTPAPTEEPPLVSVDADGNLSYHADDQGNRVPDFSMVGYRYGLDPVLPPGLPEYPLDPPPPGESALTLIQDALDDVGGWDFHEGTGFRGIVLLRSGTFEVEDSLRIGYSGVVLRGELGGEDRTVLVSTSTDDIQFIKIGAAENDDLDDEVGDRVAMADAYVPVGAMAVRVESVAKFAVGDTIRLYRPPSQEWLELLEMDDLCGPNPDPDECKNWTPDKYSFSFERIITNITDDELHLDAPVVMAFREDFGGGEVNKVVTDDPRIENVGLENLIIKSDYEDGNLEDMDHAEDAVKVGHAKDAWIRDVSCFHFSDSCVTVAGNARRVTVDRCESREPIGEIKGGLRYSFNVDGSLVLVRNCIAWEGRHDFVSGSRVKGPNVFTRCTAVHARSDIGPHQRWAMGFLYDVVTTDGAINVRERGRSGTGHGWAGANHVMWNNVARRMEIESPPDGSTNWCVGCVAPYLSGNGEYVSPGAAVEPESLYEAQVRARYGPRPSRAPTPPPTPPPYAIGLCTPLFDAIVYNLWGVCDGTADVCEAKADLDGESCDEWCDRAGLVCEDAWDDGSRCKKMKSIDCGKKGNNESICRCEKAPTSLPTPSPTPNPTRAPTLGPTPPPTEFPTNSPTPSPTPPPTAYPTPAPIYPLCTPLLYPDDLIVGDEVCENDADLCQATADLEKNEQESCDAWCDRGGYECVQAWDDGRGSCEAIGRTSCGKEGNNKSICRCERRDSTRDRLCKGLREGIWENDVCINTYEECEAVAVLNGESCDKWCEGGGLQCIGAWNDKRETATFRTSCRRKEEISCKLEGKSRSICLCGLACPAEWAPVCGANGIVYSNDCEAKRAGVVSWTNIESPALTAGAECDPEQGATEESPELFD